MITYYVIMHNMIDEGDDAAGGLEFENMGDPIQLPRQNPDTFDEFVQMHQQVWHRATHERLKEDLIEHMCGRLKRTTTTYVPVEFKFRLFYLKTKLDRNIKLELLLHLNIIEDFIWYLF